MCAATGRDPLRLMETFRSLFYTPIYVAVSGGFFQQEGLDVEFSTCPPGYHGLSALNGGIADMVQSGPMRSIIAADWGAEVVPTHIIEINSRDGFFLVGRVPQEGFQWDNLKGATLIPVGFSPMPWSSLSYALVNNGVDLADVRLIRGLSLQDAMDAFRRGDGDFIHVPQPAVEQLIHEGTGHLAVALGPVNGHIAYSSIAVTQRTLVEKAEVVQRFTQGFYNAQIWLEQSDAETISDAVYQFFSGMDKSVILRALARYKEQDTWAKDPLLREDGYDALQDVLMNAGLIASRQSYERIIRTDFALKAMGR